MAEATWRTDVISRTAAGLLRASLALIEARGLTLIGVALTNLEDQDAVQLALPFDRSGDLDVAVDRVRERFGSGSITRGALVGRDPGVSVPLLPD